MKTIWYGPENQPGSIQFLSGYSYGQFGWYFKVIIDGKPKGGSYSHCGGIYTKEPSRSFDGKDITKLLRYALLFRELECGYTTPLEYPGDLATDAKRLRLEDEKLQDELERMEFADRFAGHHAPVVTFPADTFWRMGGGCE